MPDDNVVFEWSDDGLSVVMSNTGKHNKKQKLKLEWENHSDVPTEKRLTQIYNDYFNSTEDYSDSKTEIYGKSIELPFNKQLSMGMIKKADFDDVLFRIGKYDISFPVTKNNKVVFKAPTIRKSSEFGFGGGSANNAVWLEFKNKDNE